MIRIKDNIQWHKISREFLNATPFNHVVIDNFWQEDVAEQLYTEFPKYDDNKIWNAHYNNAIENKKACNHWDKFPKTTYATFSYLGSKEFLDKIRLSSTFINYDELFHELEREKKLITKNINVKHLQNDETLKLEQEQLYKDKYIYKTLSKNYKLEGRINDIPDIYNKYLNISKNKKINII